MIYTLVIYSKASGYHEIEQQLGTADELAATPLAASAGVTDGRFVRVSFLSVPVKL